MWTDSEGSRELRPRSPPAPLVLSPSALMLQAASTATTPRIEQVNVSKNSRMHIGPSFVSVKQIVHRTEVVKGHVLGLELEASTGVGKDTGPASRRLRCSIAVFVCWALVVAAGLGVYLCRLLLTEQPTRLDLNLTAPWYLRRGDWQAMPAYGLTFLKLPVQYALVGHSATYQCKERYNCTAEVLEIQREHQRRSWDDIGPNFLITGNGLIFEGRGANVLGAMVAKWNSRGISLMFLGDYRKDHDTPTPEQLSHVAELLAVLVQAGVLHPQYSLRAHCQIHPLIYSPGRRILDELHVFEHWDRANLTNCLETKDMKGINKS